MKTPSERLRHLLGVKNISIEHLANEIGISVEWFYDLLNFEDEFESNLSIGTLWLLCEKLGTGPSWLIDGEEQEHPKNHQEEVKDLLNKHLISTGQTIEAFEDRIGYLLRSDMGEFTPVHELNVECIKNLAKELDCDWPCLVNNKQGQALR